MILIKVYFQYNPRTLKYEHINVNNSIYKKGYFICFNTKKEFAEFKCRTSLNTH